MLKNAGINIKPMIELIRKHVIVAPGLRSGFRRLTAACGFETHHLQRLQLHPACHRHPIRWPSPQSVTLQNRRNDGRRKKNVLNQSGLTSKQMCQTCRASVRDYMQICVSDLSVEPRSAAELTMSCGMFASPTRQAHSEDSSLFTEAPDRDLLPKRHASICSMPTATACFFISRKKKQLRPIIGLLMNA